MVKYPFDTDPGSKYTKENMWVSGIHIKNQNTYTGTLINAPFDVSSLKLGDVVNFDITKISDWKYEKAGKIIGGKSIKYLIENIPESQRTIDEKEYLKLFN